MLKKAISCVLVVTMLLGLTGCGSSSSSSSESSTAATEEETEAVEAEVEDEAAEAGETIEVTFAHNSTEASPWNQGVEAAIEYLSEQTDGKYEGTSYPNGSLFQSNWEILLEMTQTNSIQVGVEAMSALAAINEDVNFLCLPFLFENNDQVEEFLNNEGEAWTSIIDSFEDVGIVILGMAPRPMRQISNTKHAVNTLEDLSDLTLRAPSNNLIVAAMEALGINAVPMSSGEIFSAIQLGTVDGEDNSLAQQYDAKTLEVVKYFCICNYIADSSVMFCSKEFYDSLSTEEQQILKDMGKVFAETTYAADNDYFDVAYAAGEELGIEFTTMSAEEQARCKEACAAVYDEYEAKFDPDVWEELMSYVEATKQ
ncbi:MAG: TRAP transporter substrate-binding protein [Clostridiales bacterium]|nr:TRAP transporter substrate-binding protein [Clostridiales bacterium]